MAISRTLLAAILISILILQIVESATIVNARGGVHYHQGRTYVRELAALAVTAAIVCRRALPATTRSALVMPIKPPMAAYTNVLKL
ncbi:uncharacterized protein DS421_16g525270 [Arachis hypogaea]|nr:uncharacterized protein DS421_16g525270 [Arachis hypogaea]